MDPPTVEQIESWSKLDFEGDLGETEDTMANQLGRAIGYVVFVTGRPIDATMPTELESLAYQAIQMRVEQQVEQGQEDYVETASDDQVENFSAGGYSETRRGPLRLTRGGSEAGLAPVNSWSGLNETLWMLMTDDKQDYWRALFGQYPPAFEVTEVDWEFSDIPPELGYGGVRPGWYGGS